MVMRLIGIVILLVISMAAMGVTATQELGDLSLESLRVSPAAVDRGRTVSVSFDIWVVGSYPSVVVELTCRRADLESDCLLERKTVLLDEPFPVSTEFTVDTHGLVPGEYEITVRLDPDNSLSETSKANNRATARLTVRPPLPDLVPTLLGVQPRSPVEAGSTVSFAARIANTGSAAAAEFRVVCEILAPEGAWTAIGAVEFAGLERDQELDVSFPYTVFQEGEYGLRVRVSLVQPADPDRGVRERDEANNILETSFLVRSTDRRLPDLRPISLSLSPRSPLEWQANATATVTIVNTGGAATEDGVQVAFQYRRVGSGDAGWQDLKDPDVLKDEDGSACDPSNWQWAVRPTQSQAMSLSIEEGRNTRVLSVPIDFAAHQRSRTCNGQTVPARILPGEYELKVIVDPLGRILEQDERNNELIVGFSILGSELQAEALELSRSSVERGTDVVVKASVRNTGAKTAEAFSVGFFVGARRVDTFHYAGSGLGKEESVTVQGVIRTHDLAEGQHLVRAVIDPDGQLYEGDTSNNTVSAPLEVLGLPQRRAELFVDRIVFSPPTPISPGQTFFVRAAVSNAGDLAAERFDVVLQVSRTDGPVTTATLGIEETQWVELVQSVGRLEPLQTVWLEWPVIGLEEGLYTAQIEVDPVSEELPRGRILERDETNNRLLTGFSVLDLAGAPAFMSSTANLVCQGLVISPSAVTAGAPFTCRAVVTNTGSEPAGAFNVEWLWIYPTGQSQRLEKERIGPLGAGAAVELSRSVDTRSFPHGIHQLVLRVDIDNEVDESSTADNVCSASVAIGTTVADPRIDLLPIGVRFDSPGAVVGENNTVEQNQRLFAYVTIKNQGNVASGPFHVAFSTLLGEGREAWTSVGALDQIEVSHRLPTSVPGEYVLTIEVDPDALLLEENRANNTITATYTVIPSTVTVEEVVPPTGAPARWLATQGTDARVYAVWTDGTIRRIGSDAVQDVAVIPGSVAAVAWSLGTVPIAYLGTTDGSFYVVRLETGVVQGPILLDAPVIGLEPAGTGRVYAAVQGGLQELLLSATDASPGRMIPVEGDVLGVRYSAERATVYVLSTGGLFGYDAGGTRLCHLDAAEMVGIPATLTVSGTGVYVGTTAGTGSVVYAVSHCIPTADGAGQMLLAWRSPAIGTMPGVITSLVVDPREVDPVYVATSEGVLRSLSLDGVLQWSFRTEAPVRSTPVADKRTGRIFFGNDSGTPYILTMDGVEAFEIDRQHGAGHSIASTLVIVETRQRTVFGTQLVRNYYYGTESGAIYRIVARQ